MAVEMPAAGGLISSVLMASEILAAIALEAEESAAIVMASKAPASREISDVGLPLFVDAFFG